MSLTHPVHWPTRLPTLTHTGAATLWRVASPVLLHETILCANDAKALLADPVLLDDEFGLQSPKLPL